MSVNHAIILGFVLGLSMFLAGCRRSKTPISPNPEPNQTRDVVEGTRPIGLPFLGDDVKSATQSTLDNLKPLYRMGCTLMGVGLISGLLFRVTYGIAIAGGGFLGIATAVLFSEFPRSVLVLFGLGVVVLIVWGVVWLRRIWGGYSASKVIVPLVDELDTGPKSAGRRIKKKIEETGLATKVRKWIKYIKGLFKHGS